MLLHVVMLAAGLCLTTAAKTPSYIKRCARDDPAFNACALASARAARDDLVRGDRALGRLPLDPLRMTQLVVEQQGSVGLNITLNDVVIVGLAGIEFTDNFNFDVGPNQLLAYEVLIPRLEITADYVISGKILILPVTGQGRANVTLINSNMKVSSPYKVVTRAKGKQHIFFEPSEINIRPQKAFINFGNLFNGDPLLGPQTNLFLTENWKDVFAELGPTMSQAIGAAAQQNVQVFADKIPYDELVPPTLSA